MNMLDSQPTRRKEMPLPFKDFDKTGNEQVLVDAIYIGGEKFAPKTRRYSLDNFCVEDAPRSLSAVTNSLTCSVR